MQVEGVFKVRRTPNQEKALKWFIEDRGLTPQLSAHPIYYFKDKNGNEEKHDIFYIMVWWESMRKDAKRDGEGRL